LKYLDFEGTIPKGEYGGGSMIVWDQGLWAPVYDPEKSLAKGHLEFELAGERLKGRWHLVRMKTKEKLPKEDWLLIKADDEFQRSETDPNVIEEYTGSILSGLTTEELEKTDAVRTDHKKRIAVTAARQVKLPDPAKVRGARKGLLPVFI